MLTRDDLVAPGKQDKNAGNSGDLVKHTAYLSLLRILAEAQAAHGKAVHIIEAHSGKGVYISAHPHLRKARKLPGYADSTLGTAQKAAFATGSAGLGRVSGLRRAEVSYAGSPVLHARAIAGSLASLTLLDRDRGIRQVADRVLSQAAFTGVRRRVAIEDPGDASEKYVSARLRTGAIGSSCLLHFDPFAFVMAQEDAPIRTAYRELVGECQARVRDGKLAGASVFFTWGSNGAAALEDLDGNGYCGGLPGGFQDLVRAVSEVQRVVVRWCWEFHFAMLVIVPAELKAAIACVLEADTRWLGRAMSRFEILA